MCVTSVLCGQPGPSVDLAHQHKSEAGNLQINNPLAFWPKMVLFRLSLVSALFCIKFSSVTGHVEWYFITDAFGIIIKMR